MEYMRLMRVKHYLKNALVFLPILFNKSIFNEAQVTAAILGFICFSLVSSAVYILNDIRDIEKDRNHPKKKERPLASGKVSIKSAVTLMSICLLAALMISLLLEHKSGLWLLLAYLGINAAYSFGLKNYPIIDVVILSAGFVIRLFYGGIVTGIELSKWLYLVIVSGSLFMGLGKRRNELKQQKNTRAVLKYYNEAFLDKNMYVALALVIVFYALWTVDFINPAMAWTVPSLMVILLKYSYNIEGASDGDPVEILFHDKILLSLTLVHIIFVLSVLYIS